MPTKLTIKVPPSPYVRSDSLSSLASQTGKFHSLKPKPSVVKTSGRLRDYTEYHSEYSDYDQSDNDYEEPGTARDMMLPSPSEYEALDAENPFERAISVSPPTSVTSLSTSSSVLSIKSSSSSNSRGSSSSKKDALAKPVSKTTRNRWGGFWGRSDTGPVKETVVQVGHKWETDEEILLKLKREEEMIERLMAEEQEAALEKLRSLGVKSKAVELMACRMTREGKKI
ncbi:hypothetical protein SCUP234_01420 [Seiridium cupressi]